MGAHLHLSSPPQLTSSSPWKPRLIPRSNAHQTPSQIHTFSPKRSIRLRAQRKGFGSPVPEPKRRRPEEDENKSARNEDDDDDAIPQVVFDRIIRRVLSSVTLPMATGLGLLYLLTQAKERGLWDVPAWLPLLTVLIAFGSSALGMAYGTLSTSWDPNTEGTLLGWDEAVKNWPEIMKERE